VSRKFDIAVEDVYVGVWPHVAAHILLIIVFMKFPQLVLWRPNSM
jgi:TRAP-type mannitol/chloroaromatic compound transport system permease large subunit